MSHVERRLIIFFNPRFTLAVTIINLPLGIINPSLTPLWVAIIADFCFITFFVSCALVLDLSKFDRPRCFCDTDFVLIRESIADIISVGTAIPRARSWAGMVEDSNSSSLRYPHSTYVVILPVLSNSDH
jgi:hypothetical protein